MWRLAVLLVSLGTLEASFYDRAMEGRYYYQENSPEEEEQPKITEENAAQELNLFRQKLETAKALAVMAPTYENVSSFMFLQKRLIATSEKFSQVWAKVLLENALLNEELRNPTAAYAISARKTLNYQNIDKALKDSKSAYVLLFVFESEDPYSQIAAEMVRDFEYETNWKVFGVSVDGKPLPQFPSPRVSKNKTLLLGQESTPAYIIVNPDKDESINVGFGAISISQLKENIYKQLKEKKDL